MPKYNRDFKGIWIPKYLWLNEDLSITKKTFLAEIDSLDNGKGCWATNSYFAKFFGLSKHRAGAIIQELVKEGYLHSKIIYKKGTKQVEKRYLTLSAKSQRGYMQNHREGICENAEDNNTYNNTNDNSEVETSQEISKQRNKNIGQIIKWFDDYKVNAGASRWYRNKTEREASGILSDKFPIEQIEKAISILPELNKLPRYEFPLTKTPLQLLENWHYIENRLDQYVKKRIVL